MLICLKKIPIEAAQMSPDFALIFIFGEKNNILIKFDKIKLIYLYIQMLESWKERLS